MLRLVSLAMVLYSYFLVRTSLPELPRCIPTHFNAAGEPNGWGSPDTLWTLLGVQILVSVIFLGVPYLGQRFPQTVNLGLRRLGDYTPEQRLRILPLLHDWMGYMSILANLFFVALLRDFIHAAVQPHPRLHIGWPLGLLLGGALGLTFYYIRRINRAAKEEARS
ncbi:MAG: DUF1648 domain-containing protein [Terriglobia bacterium]|jgi:uncharacterized membrane protein